MHLGSSQGPSSRAASSAIPAAETATYQVAPSFEELGLTPRQADVLTQLLQGKPNKEIARRLGLSVETVKDHVQAGAARAGRQLGARRPCWRSAR